MLVDPAPRRGEDLMRILVSLIAGGLSGAGLFVSGMANTHKVQGWLDVFGAWDPTLAFVMGGAIIPMFFRLASYAKPTALVGRSISNPNPHWTGV